MTNICPLTINKFGEPVYIFHDPYCIYKTGHPGCNHFSGDSNKCATTPHICDARQCTVNENGIFEKYDATYPSSRYGPVPRIGIAHIIHSDGKIDLSFFG